MVSRITGLIRETLVARAFGASIYTDAFNVAFRIPNLLRRLFAEGAFSQAFVPILGEIKNRDGDRATHQLVDAVATVLAWTLIAVCLAGVIGAPVVVGAVATGFKARGDAFALAVVMNRIMFPYIGLISMVSLASGILNIHRNFSVPAFTPVLLNLSVIGAALWLAPQLEAPVYALAWGVLAGGVAQLALQVPALVRVGMLPRVRLDLRAAWHHPGVRRVLKLMLPATLSVSVAQLSLIINTNIASRLVSGSVSWLTYADRLMEFPTALLGVALGTVLMPSLTKAHAEGDHAGYAALLDWGLRLTLLLAVPAAAALFVFGAPLTAVLFHYGKFSALDVEMTRQALVSYGVGLTGLILIKILAPGFYAKQDIRTPVRIALVVLATTQLSNLVFVPQFGHAGLALSIGVGATLNALLLFVGLKMRGIYRPAPGWLKFVLQLTAGVAVMTAALAWAAHAFDWIGLRAAPWLRIGLLFACLAGAAAAYFGTLTAAGMKLSAFRRHQD